MTREAIHQGETVRDDLDVFGTGATELARGIGVPVNCIADAAT